MLVGALLLGVATTASFLTWRAIEQFLAEGRRGAAATAVAPAVAPTVGLEAASASAPRSSAGTGPPLSEESRAELLSDVPHRVLREVRSESGADTSGDHRLFIAVVDPGLATRDLERLVRDLRAAHRRAAVLDIRIYDSEQAALAGRRGAGQIEERRHRVAELRRNDRLGVDVARIRGTSIELE